MLIVDCLVDCLESGWVIYLDDVVFYFYIGGIIGMLKLVLYSYFNEVVMVEIMGLNVDYGVDDVLFCGLLLFYVNGVMVIGLVFFYCGV